MRFRSGLPCLLLASFTGSAHAQGGAAPDANDRGIFLYTLNVAVEKSPADSPQMQRALAVPGTDGVTLVESWSAIEPALGVFAWDPPTPAGQSLFDQWISTAVSSGKRVNLAIRAGEYTPCWLFDSGCPAGYSGGYAGAVPLAFESAPHQGQTRGCEAVEIAAPWDPVFLREWDAMLAAVARHLRSTGAYGAVSMVRLTGINRTTDELRLPEEILSTSFSPPDPCTANSITTWLAAGYRPSRLLQAWDAITSSFAEHFPDKTFNVPIIPDDTGQGQFPFPEIGDDGCVYTQVVIPDPDCSVPPAIPSDTCGNPGEIPDLNQPLLELASQKFPGRLIVEFENLDTSRPASSAVVDAALNLGTMAGFMTNNYFAAQGAAGAACSGGFVTPQRCADSAAYLALLEIGIYPQVPDWMGQPFDRSTSLRSQYLEVLAPDVVPPECSGDAQPPGCGYPNAIWQAHTLLVDVTPPQVTAAADPSVLWPPQGQMVLVTVAGTVSDDLSGVDRSSAAFVVRDGVGAIQAQGPVTLDVDGSYSFALALQASRSGSDLDGRLYRISVSAQDNAGNVGSALTTVVVPHDRRD